MGLPTVRKWIAVCALTCLMELSASAFWQSRDSNYNVNIVSGGGSCTASNTETTTWCNAVVTAGGTVSAGRLTVVNTLVTCLKTNNGGGGSPNLFGLHDRMFLFASENSQQALTDLITATTIPGANVHNSPTFTVDQGYTGIVASSTFIDTGFDASIGTNQYTLNSASFTVYPRTIVQGNKIDIGVIGTGGAGPSQMLVNFDGSTDFSAINSGAPGIVATTTAKFITLSRTASNLMTKYENGSSVATSSSASGSGVTNNNMYILARNNSGADSFTDHQLSIVAVGGGLNSTQAANLSTCLSAYKTSVGF